MENKNVIKLQNEVNKLLEEVSEVLTIDERWTRYIRANVGVRKGVNAKKAWITAKMIEKVDERRRWKAINTEEGRKMFRMLDNKLSRETVKAR